MAPDASPWRSRAKARGPPIPCLPSVNRGSGLLVLLRITNSRPSFGPAVRPGSAEISNRIGAEADETAESKVNPVTKNSNVNTRSNPVSDFDLLSDFVIRPSDLSPPPYTTSESPETP